MTSLKKNRSHQKRKPPLLPRTNVATYLHLYTYTQHSLLSQWTRRACTSTCLFQPTPCTMVLSQLPFLEAPCYLQPELWPHISSCWLTSPLRCISNLTCPTQGFVIPYLISAPLSSAKKMTPPFTLLLEAEPWDHPWPSPSPHIQSDSLDCPTFKINEKSFISLHIPLLLPWSPTISCLAYYMATSTLCLLPLLPFHHLLIAEQPGWALQNHGTSLPAILQELSFTGLNPNSLSRSQSSCAWPLPLCSDAPSA